LPSFALELGRPVQKRFFAKTLWRLGITAAFLHHHDIKFLVHINPKSADWTDSSEGELDDCFAAIKLAAGSLV
jgi:hypothetical protein